MKIANGRIVTMTYSVQLDDGTEVESAREKPVDYLHGADMLLPELEIALENLDEGATKRFILRPHQAYGHRDEASVITLPRSLFDKPGVELHVGARLGAKTSQDDIHPVTVLEIRPNTVVVDLNHPLAGKNLHFDVHIRAVRAADTGELFTGKPRTIEVV